MALVRFGAAVSEIRGSINGATFFRTRSGATVRNRIKPVNPNTMNQAQIRYLFSYVASEFAKLNKQQKEEWTEYARSLAFWKNRLGESYTPSARQVFQYCNMNLILSSTGLAAVSPGSIQYIWNFNKLIKNPVIDLTEKPEPPQFQNGDFSFVATQSAGVLTQLISNEASIAPPSAVDEPNFILEATRAYSPTLSNRKNKYRLIQAFTAGGAIDALGSYNNVLPQSGLTSDMTIHLRLSTVNKAGLRSDPLEIEVKIG